MGKRATKEKIVDMEAEINEDGEIDVILIVEEEPDLEGFGVEIRERLN